MFPQVVLPRLIQFNLIQFAGHKLLLIEDFILSILQMNAGTVLDC